MTNVTMKAKDMLHISSVKSTNLEAGEQFEVPGYMADDLEERALAERVVKAAPASAKPVRKAK